MRSDLHKALYERLLDITTRVERALVTGSNPGALDELAGEHMIVIKELKEAGLSRDPELLDLAKETSDRVRRLIGELERRRADTRGQMAAVSNRERLARAYKRFKV